MLKLSLGDRVASKTCQKLIRDYRQQCERDLSYLGEIESALCEPPPKHRDQSYWLMTLRHGRAIRDAELDWCNDDVIRIDSGMKI
jgi:hypothetical protein